MPTEKDDPRLKGYVAETAKGVKRLHRVAARTKVSRMAPKTHWEEKWVGVVHGYPKTPEAFEERKLRGREKFAKLRAEGRLPSRKGVPDGWKGRREEVVQIKAEAEREAERIMAHLAQDGYIDETDLDEKAGNSALRMALAIVHDRTEKSEVRLKAATLVANFTKSRPVQKVETVVSPAEAWLAQLAAGKLPGTE